MPADFADRTDFENANRGLIARLEPGVVKAADGRVVFDADAFTRATAGDCPDTVHPSLWRHRFSRLFRNLLRPLWTANHLRRRTTPRYSASLCSPPSATHASCSTRT